MATDQEEFRGMFKPFIGKKVELSFASFKIKSSNDAKHIETKILNQTHTINPKQCSTHGVHKGKSEMDASDDKSASRCIHGCHCRIH